MHSPIRVSLIRGNFCLTEHSHFAHFFLHEMLLIRVALAGTVDNWPLDLSSGTYRQLALQNYSALRKSEILVVGA